MGIFDTMLNALGLRRSLTVKEPGPLAVLRGGEARLDRLPHGTVAIVTAEPQEGGWLAAVTEGPPPGPPFEELVTGAVIRPVDRERLHGLHLDHDGHRWKVVLDLTVYGAETPNPDGRLYTLDRPLHRGRPSFYTRSTERAPLLARRLLADPGVRSVLLRGNTLTLERSDATPWDRLDRHVDASLREHFLLGGGVVDGDEGPQRDDPLEDAVAQVLEAEILPGVHRDGGNIVLGRVEDGVAYVHMEGACASCPASILTLKGAVEKTLKSAFPGEVERVEAI